MPTFTLGAFPLSIANANGSMNKACKSKLMGILLDEVELESVTLPENRAVIIDAMAMLQVLSVVPNTFGDLSEMIFSRLTNLANRLHASRIDFVADQYPAVSIKNSERGRRAAHGTTVLKILNRDQQTPRQWKKYMANGDNKEELIQFFVNDWSRNTSLTFQDTVALYVTNKKQCVKYETSPNGTTVRDIPELCSDHEEADTRLLLHAKHAMENDCQGVIVNSPDTDVLVLMVAMEPSLPGKLFMLKGTEDIAGIIPVERIYEKLPARYGDALIGFHAFTGCDTVSGFYGKGKKKCWDQLPAHLGVFQNLGDQPDPTPDIIEGLARFLCSLYGQKKITSVNSARYALFRLGQHSDQNMPPTSHCLERHVRRAAYQAYVWKCCLKNNIDAPDPIARGWKLVKIEIDWMSLNIAPDQILELVNCGCKRECSCKKAGLFCTQLCKCCNCENISDDPVQLEQEQLIVSIDFEF